MLDIGRFMVDGIGKKNATSFTSIITSTQSWTVPAGVTEIYTLIVGGGGGGGGSTDFNQMSGGGGGGGYTKFKRWLVNGNDAVSIVIGVGGAGKIVPTNTTVSGDYKGATGGSSTVTIDAITVSAPGGVGGDCTGASALSTGGSGQAGGGGGARSTALGGAGGSGLTGSNGGSSAVASGGSGFNEYNHLSVFNVAPLVSLGGGGGGGTGSATIPLGGAGGGGNGGYSPNPNGSNATTYAGGGGGGARLATLTTGSGGNGYQGIVYVTYYL